MNKLMPLLLMPCLCNAGEFLDKPTIHNNSYLNARYLNHTTGRFLTQDVMKQFNSHYIYGSGNVIMLSDPSGMMWESEYPFGRKGLMGHYNSENPSASLDKAVAKMSEHDNPRSGILSTAKEKVSKLVIKPIASGVNKVIQAITPDVSISAEVSVNRYKGRNEYLGTMQDSYDVNHATRLLSMRDTLEKKVRYDMMSNGHYAASEGAYEHDVKTNTSNEMDNYIRIRNKDNNGLATRSDKSQLRKYHGYLLDNDGYVKQTITNLGKINKMTYWDMNQKLVELYAEGPWLGD